MGGLGWGLLAGPNPGEIVGSLEGVPDRARAGAEELRRTVFPFEVTLPDVEELDEEAARKRLDEAGLGTVARDRRSNEEDAGQVLEQSVPAGKKVEESSRILLAISSGSGPGGQQGSAPDPAPDPTPGDRPRDPERADGSDGSPGPPNPGDYGGSGSGAGAASSSPEPAPSIAPDAGQGVNRAPLASPEPSSPEPSSREVPASAPSSPEPASPPPSSSAPATAPPGSPPGSPRGSPPGAGGGRSAGEDQYR